MRSLQVRETAQKSIDELNKVNLRKPKKPAEHGLRHFLPNELFSNPIVNYLLQFK